MLGVYWRARVGAAAHAFADVELTQLGAVVVVVALGTLLFAPGSGHRAGARAAASVELVGKRTETSKTFRNGDGTLTTSLYSSPVHYRDGDKWVDIDSTLVKSDVAGYALTNRANAFHAHLKDTLGDDYLRLDAGGHSYAFTAVGAAAHAVESRGASASYKSAFDGVDLRYDMLADGVKETLVLSDASVPTHYRFTLAPVDGSSLELSARGDGSYDAVVPDSDVTPFSLAAPQVVDAAGASAADAASLTATKEGDRWSIDLAVDARWLHAKNRTFPVQLDPTITIQPPVQSSTWNQSNTTGALTANPAYLKIGTDASAVNRSAVLFDLGAVPVGANVSDAQLKLYYDGTCVVAGCSSTSHQLDVYRMSNFWIPSAKIANVKYDSTAPLSSFTLAAGATAQWMSWPVTTAVNQWRTELQPNFGLLLKRSNEALNSNGPAAAGSNYADATLKPRLDVTYVDDGFELLPPTTLHANGADLAWTPYVDPGGAPFDRYEVYRSATPGFNPTPSTLVATIRDPSATTYRDTTAASSKTFTYKVVVNGTASSVERTVTLPADGQATKTLRPGPAAGKTTYIVYQGGGAANCGNYGAFAFLKFGEDATYLRRSLLQFDLRDIPANASVAGATLSLFHRDPIPAALSGTASVHRVTSDWTEGTSGSGVCSGDGATWNETVGGVKWQTPGGDFDAANETQLTLTPNEEPAWHDYALTSLVQRWMNGTVPNLGVLMKLDDETMANGRMFYYVADDYSIAPTLRPRLTVTYADGSHAQGPNVAVSQPASGDSVGGKGTTLGVSASDDGRVTKVEYSIDGGLVGTSTAAPFSLTWDATSVSNGNHTVTATAEDDAGNRTTSAAVTFKVDNTAPPTTAYVSPAPYASVVKADGPMAYWRLGESSGTTLTDAMGSYNGTYYGGTTLGRKGGLVNDPSTGAAFDGSTGYAEVANVNPGNALSATTTATIEGWVLPPDKPTTYNGYFGIRNDANADLYVLQLANTNTLEFRYRQSGGTSYTINAPITPNVWHYVALTLSPVTMTITGYIDGNAVASGAAYGKLGDVSLPFDIARTAATWSTGRVTVDDVALYNKTLSAGAIARHYAAGAPAAQADNPLALWRLGESSGATAYDAEGRYNGTYYGTETLGLPGALVNDTSTATSFDGSTGYAEVANVNDATAGPLATAGKYSIEGWVVPSNLPTTHNGYFGLRNDSNADFYVLQLMNTNQLECRFRNSAGTAYTVTTSAITTGVWHHVALTYDGATLTCLVDGQPLGSLAATGVLANVAEPFDIGRTGYNWSAAKAKIDDVAAYTKALTWAQVKAHYDAQKQIIGAQARATSSLTATAADDVGVTKVEFYVDDNKVGESTQAPYAVDWNTLDAQIPTYDGTHTLTTKAYDTSGQVTTSAPVSLGVANAPAGSPYAAGFVSTTAPSSMTWDPNGGASQQSAGVDVTVSNKSSVTWSAANVVLRYRWVSSDATAVYSDGGDVPFSADLAPGGSQTLRAVVPPPALPAGTDRAQYTLRFDLFDKGAGAWFTDKGNAPLDNPVVVDKALTRDALGLERYYHYTGLDVGAGMSQMTNVANGNSILRWTPWDENGTGLSTVLDLTYNALEKKCECPSGNNWSLSISTLTRFGNPIDVHPNKADSIAGNANKFIQFNDGDGTTIRFTDSNNDGYWEAPAGVHLYLRQYSTTNTDRYWALSRPDRTTFFYNQDGFPTAVQDNDGNTLTFTLTPVAPADDPGGPRFHITSVKDQGGRTFDIAYYTKADAKKPQIRGKVKQITDHLKHALAFDYYDDGNLLRITQKGGTNPDGSVLADRTFVFTYTTSDGSGPAIPSASARANPDSKTPNESTRIYSVRDPRGYETTFAYLGPGYGNDRWKLASVTDRAGNTTSFSYDTVNRVTTVTEPLSRVSKYAYDTEGKVTQITNPLDQVTTVDWSGDRAVAKVTEPSGTYTRYGYNDNGYLTDEYVLTDRKDPSIVSDDVVAHTQLTYQNIAVDSNDVSTKWETGRTIPHYSQLATKTNPKGVATSTPTDDYQWSFTYTPAGDLQTATDPLKNTETFAYNTDGTLATETDANAHKTTYPSYDANGLPTKVVDGIGNATADPDHHAKTFGYDAAGNLQWVQDELHQFPATGLDARAYRSWFDYDPFGRLVRQSAPKSTSMEPNRVIWSDAAYDPNDNVVTIVDQHFGTPQSDPKENTPPETTTYDAMDRVTADVAPHDPTSTDPAQKSRRSEYAYDAAGRLIKATDPKGTLTTSIDKDFATFYGYDPIDRVTTQTSYQVDSAGNVTQTQASYACFDLAGDLRSVTAPKNATETDPAKKFTGCPAAASPYTPTAASFTTKYAYNDAHELVSQTDPEGHLQSVTYDLNGDVDTMTDESNVVGKRFYDQRGQLVKEVEPFRSVTGGTRDLVTQYEYDPVGNLKREITPRAYDASTDPNKQTFTDYVTSYEYDANDQLVREVQPTSATDTQKLYVHRHYDAGGNVDWTSESTDQGDWTIVPESDKSSFTYNDTGDVRTSKDPAQPRVGFDYDAQGNQVARTPDGESTETWTYFADGQLKEQRDPTGDPTTYAYDPNGSLTTVDDTNGVQRPDEQPIHVDQSYDGFDRLVKIRQQKLGKPWHYTTYGYDLNDNIVTEEGDATENADGTVTAGRKVDWSYDTADWVTQQIDHGTDPGCADDQRLDYSFFPTGTQKDQLVWKAGAGCTSTSFNWSLKQQTSRDYFLDGSLKTQQTWNGPSSSAQLVQSHTLSYESGGIYLNGNIATDTFTVSSPDSAAPCQSSACTTTYTYDAKDRLTKWDNARGGLTDYTLDPHGNVKTESTGGVTRTFNYTNGDQLSEIDSSASGVQPRRFWYTHGNLVCETQDESTTTSARSDCPDPQNASVSSRLRATYDYDKLDRMTAYHGYAKNQTTGGMDNTDSSSYTYDAFDRVSTENETHAGASRSTSFDFVDVSDDVAKETRTGDQATTKAYSYDAFDDKAGMTDSASGGNMLYGYNARGDVEQLLDAAGAAKVTYGYKAYGDDEGNGANGLSRGDSAKSPLNPYRYAAQRFDSGSSSIDMGARRFSPDLGRFLENDFYRDALADLDLAFDPLTGNRYGYSGGNPINFVEIDGHFGLPHFVKHALHKVEHVAKSAVHAATKVAKYCLGSGAATCSMVAAGVALTATGVGAVAGGGLIATAAGATATGATVASRALGAYATVRGTASDIKHRNYAGLAITAATLGRGRGAASEVERRAASEIKGGVYTLRNAKGEVEYVGRTKNFKARQLAHKLNPKKRNLDFHEEAYTNDYNAQRGLEQRAMNHYRPRQNKIRGISRRNPNRRKYLLAARGYHHHFYGR